mmetsp:Transcript_53580/g.116431  ORF Transcript_53580/g.116431 Transcript_53580/m.116431 type:complete len:103 (+) Transcript_53580:518-826(+)
MPGDLKTAIQEQREWVDSTFKPADLFVSDFTPDGPTHDPALPNVQPAWHEHPYTLDLLRRIGVQPPPPPPGAAAESNPEEIDLDEMEDAPPPEDKNPDEIDI